MLAREIGYPLVVRPSYVLGGRAMEIVHGESDLARYMRDAVKVSHDSPVLLDRFLDDAIEVDVDFIADNTGAVLVGGVMEHIEEAGVHSGDSSCSLPPYSLSAKTQAECAGRSRTGQGAECGRADEHPVRDPDQDEGDDVIFLLEVNPRASRTVPFVSKATGMPLAKIAARCMAGKSLAEQGAVKEIVPHYYSVKEAIFPFAKFQGVDPILGPEMRSTGEVMGVGRNFGAAFARAQEAGGIKAPPVGKVFLSVRDPDKSRVLPVAKDLIERGYTLVATRGTCAWLQQNGHACEQVNKVVEGRPHIVDLIKNGEIVYIVNTTEGRQAISDSFSIGAKPCSIASPIRLPLPVPCAGAFAGFPRHRPRLGAAGIAQGVAGDECRAPLTLKGAQRLREELDQLKSVKRPAVIAAIAEARAHGDLKENAEYHAAREQQSFIEGRISSSKTSSRVPRLSMSPSSRRLAGNIRRHRDPGRRGNRRREALPDRRRPRSRYQAGEISIASPFARA